MDETELGSVESLESEVEFEPFHYKVDDTDIFGKLAVNDSEEVDVTKKPTLADLVNTCETDPDGKIFFFRQGMYVEYRSNLSWKLGRITRVILVSDSDVDVSSVQQGKLSQSIIRYVIGGTATVNYNEVRAPRAGLQAIFGSRPLLWQQYVYLQLEKRLRFSEHHEYDFENINTTQFALRRWEAFVDAPENHEFKVLYESTKEISKTLLLHHLTTGFTLIDEIINEWDYNDPDISVYTYLALLGSGTTTAFLTLIVQIVTPFLLIYNNFFLTDLEPNPRWFVEEDENGNVVLEQNAVFPFTDFETFCNQEGVIEGKILTALVLVIYLYSVVFPSYTALKREGGLLDSSTSSKIHMMFIRIWHKQRETSFQEVGYKLDRMMNAGYISFLYLVMIYITLNTPVVLDIILNALAVQFIHKIDEIIVLSSWWDPDHRWAKAGTIELVIQFVVESNVLRSVKSTCKKYDIDFGEYKDRFGNKSLRDASQAYQDDENVAYMTRAEKLFQDVAKNSRSTSVIKDYSKYVAQFGIVDQSLSLFKGNPEGVFRRHPSFRAWSRWHKVLFMPKLPDKEEIEMRLNKPPPGIKYEIPRGQVKAICFFLANSLVGDHITTILKTFRNLKLHRLPTKLLLSMGELFFLIMSLFFPFILVIALLAVPFCY